MTTFKQQTTSGRSIDWPVILFFVLAYAIAWGTFGIVGLIARQAGLDSAQTLMAMGEAYQFEGVSLAVPYWLVYVLTRLADFSFSIAGVVMIAVTAGRVGLRELWGRLTRFRIGWVWYVDGLLPVLLYILATAFAGALSSSDFSMSAIATALFSLQAGFFVSLFLRGAMGEELGGRFRDCFPGTGGYGLGTGIDPGVVADRCRSRDSGLEEQPFVREQVRVESEAVFHPFGVMLHLELCIKNSRF